MSRFGGLGQAKVSKGGVWFVEGAHIVEIQKVLYVAGRKGEFFCVEAKILESDTMKAGTQASQMIKMSLDSAAGNIKAFIGAALGIDDVDNYEPEDGSDVDLFWEEAAELAVDEENALGGTVINLRCSNITTNAGNPFTKHFWGPVVED